MEKRQLECGHQAHVPHGRSGTWCPACNDIRLLARDTAASREPVTARQTA